MIFTFVLLDCPIFAPIYLIFFILRHLRKKKAPMPPPASTNAPMIGPRMTPTLTLSSSLELEDPLTLDAATFEETVELSVYAAQLGSCIRKPSEVMYHRE